jgi:CheY-like chemotaxis protein
MANKFKTCLLVEDDQEDRDFFVKALLRVSSKTGCYAVSNGEEALTALTEDGISPDYIFTDIQMPRMNGVEFLRKIKSLPEFRDIPVIVYSSAYSDQQIQQVLTLGAHAFYSKARFKVLPEILGEYFGDRQPSSFYSFQH